MNNSTANFTSATVSADLVNELYLGYVETLIDVSLLALLSYATILAIPQEMEYMWSRKYISITTVLYAFTRYGSLIAQALVFWFDILPSLGSLYNILIYVQGAEYTLTSIGAQGLLVARAYSLCQGNRFIAGALVFFFMAGLILNIYLNSADSTRIPNVTSANSIEILVTDICICLTDMLAFGVCMWKVWGTWKLKRETGIQGYNDLVSVLIRQTVSRFGFVITFTVTATILTEMFVSILQQIMAPLLQAPIRDTSPIYLFINFQKDFSTMLLADFALVLRRQNSAAIRAANITLPNIEITSVMSYVHESILVEMGDHENDQGMDSDDDPPAGSGPQDVEIQSESV